MNFIQISPAREKAVEIQQCIDETINFAGAQLNRIYSLVNTPGLQQEILDKFGPNGVAALSAYAAFQQALESVKPGSAPAPNSEVFVPQEDGTIVYQAPNEV